LLKATVGAEFLDEEWHPVSTEDVNSNNNVAVRATMCGRDTIDLRHDPRQGGQSAPTIARRAHKQQSADLAERFLPVQKSCRLPLVHLAQPVEYE
jgi:hypothetical protein